MTERKSLQAGIAPAVASTVAFAVLPILISQLLALGFSSYQVMTLRFTLAVPLSLLYLLMAQRRILREWRGCLTGRTIALGVLFFLTALFMTIGLESLDPAIGNVIFYTFPFLVLLIEVVRGFQRFSWALLCSMVLIFVGIVVLNSPQGDVAFQVGILWCLGSAATFTAYLLLNRQQETSQFDAMVSIPFWCAALSVLTTVLSPASWPACSAACLWQVVGLATVPTIVALHLVNVSLRTITASSFSVISSTEPLFVLLLSLIISRQLLALHEVAAFAMITIGSVVATVSALRPAPGENT
ncbi:EamA family transporter [Deinococcus sp. HMF7620]|uniref:EamA family transporter n=1 Tax=Deinococcus arboris TaxID=2682977 RepID=A0A7C9I200_9DEIO|nr:DMT family transporter [Deinococcus arboris]MVN89228.1 EamA family transporter [Deinococcus arboris]